MKDICVPFRLVAVCGFFLLISTLHQARAQASERSINLYAYNHVSDGTPTLSFTLPADMGERKMTVNPDFEFYSDKEVTLKFDVTIAPNGKVKYVKPPRCDRELTAYRNGGIAALYESKFDPVPTANGDQKASIAIYFPKID